jgi:hypothetical protein
MKHIIVSSNLPNNFYVTYIKSFLIVWMIIIAVNVTLHNNIFHSNSYIILICVMCLWPGLVVDTRYNKICDFFGSTVMAPNALKLNFRGPHTFFLLISN